MRRLLSKESEEVYGGTVCLYNTDPKRFYIELHSISDSLMWSYSEAAVLHFTTHGVFAFHFPSNTWAPLTVSNMAQYGIQNIDCSSAGDFCSLNLA